MAIQPKPEVELRSRRQLMELLKQHGPQDASTLADWTGVSAMAVRQHLYELQAEKLVVYDEQPRPIGRPAKMWRLTDQANRFFPDGHAALTVDLIASLSEEFGAGGMDRLIAARTRSQISRYQEQLAQRMSLPKKLERLAAMRTDEGYMAEVLPQPDGSYLLVENHCPILRAATACTGLCSSEFQVFHTVLGEDVKIERTEHILSGAAALCLSRAKKTEAGLTGR